MQPGSIYIPPDLPGAEFQSGDSRPDAVLYFRLFAGAMALLHVGLVLVGLVFLIAPVVRGGAGGGPSGDDLVAGVIYLVWGTLLAIPYLIALLGGRHRWVHTLGTVLIVITLISVCCLPVAIPLLIQWQKPETPAVVRDVSLSFHHAAVLVLDLERAERFYVDVLGLPVLRRWEDAAGRPRSVWLALGGGAFLAVELARPDAPARTDAAPGWHCVALGIAAAEREAWRARLAAAGHPVERETDFTLYVRDPDGSLVALSHYPEPAAG